jgi:acetylornithine deacetylase
VPVRRAWRSDDGHDVRWLALELVGIDSANPATAVDGPGEGDIAPYVVRWLNQHGLDVAVDTPEPGRPSVIALARGRGGGRSLMLVGHLDTFMRPDQGAVRLERRGAVLSGVGAVDMKASVAALMVVASNAAKEDLRGDVILALVSDEEHQSVGIRSVLSRWVASAAILAEGTDLSLGTAHEGRIDIVLEAETRGGALPPDLRAALQSQAAAGRLGYAIEPGPLPRVRIRRLLSPWEAAHEHRLQLQEAIGDRFPVVYTHVREAFLSDVGHPVVRCLLSTMRRRHLEVRQSMLEGWTEASILAAAGIPTIVFGPVGGGAHTYHEWVDLGSVECCCAVLSDAVLEYCG